MNVEVKTRISRNIEDVWSLVADDFTSIQRWSKQVVTSQPLEPAGAVCDAPMAGRYCTFTDDPQGFAARETITKYDKANFVLEFDVVPVNGPAALPLKKNFVRVTLKALSPTTTELTWSASPELKAHGYLMYPLLQMGMKKSFQGIIDELRDYAQSLQSEAA